MERLFKLEPVHCENCEHLRLLLEQERMERRSLIEKITPYRGENVKTEPVDYKPVQSRYTPFSVKRAQLEQADRILAEQRRADARSKENAAITSLEKELGVEEKENAG